GGQPEVEFLAERSTRLVGSMIDNFLALIAALPGSGLYIAMANSEKSLLDNPVSLGMIAFPVLCLIGYQWYLTSTTGQTLAKKWLKMKIVKMDGSDIDFVSGVILRSWVVQAAGFLPVIGGFVGLIDAVMIFGEERRCLHDMIAGTKVIMTSDR